MREFWSNPKTADLKRETSQLRDAVKFGDPLYVARQVGRGRVAVMLTTAGEVWTDWPTGPGRPFMARWKAWLTISGMRRASSICVTHLAIWPYMRR